MDRELEERLYTFMELEQKYYEIDKDTTEISLEIKKIMEELKK